MHKFESLKKDESRAQSADYSKAVVLNRGYTYPLGVPNTTKGGTKHQHF